MILRTGLNLNANQTANALQDKPAKAFSIDVVQLSDAFAGSPRDSLSLADFKGQPLIVNFWASWCVSCKTEALEIERFWKTYKDKGVRVIGIAVHDTVPAAENFIRRYRKTYTIGLDKDGKAGINYGVTGVPETFFIDRSGVIRHKEAGPVNFDLMQQKLGLILN